MGDLERRDGERRGWGFGLHVTGDSFFKNASLFVPTRRRYTRLLSSPITMTDEFTGGADLQPTSPVSVQRRKLFIQIFHLLIDSYQR
jgi:hypothetical protein